MAVLLFRTNRAQLVVIRDLQYRFSAEGRDYVVEVCAPGKNPAPISAGMFDVHITFGVAEILPEWRKVEPEVVVRKIANHAVRFVPASVTRAQWTKFADAVLAWVCAHQATMV